MHLNWPQLRGTNHPHKLYWLPARPKLQEFVGYPVAGSLRSGLARFLSFALGGLLEQ